MPLVNLTQGDVAALEIGRLFMRAHTAEQQAVLLAARLSEFEQSAEEKPADVSDQVST